MDPLLSIPILAALAAGALYLARASAPGARASAPGARASAPGAGPRSTGPRAADFVGTGGRGTSPADARGWGAPATDLERSASRAYPPAPRAHPPGTPLPLVDRDPERVDRLAAHLRAADQEPWIELRSSAWKARRRWFAEPAWRDRLLARLCPEGGAAPAPPEGRAGVVHRWLGFLAEAVDAAEDPELRPRVAALYGPWRGFALDLRRFVERRRAALTDGQRAQLPPPAWLEPLARLDGRLFHDVPYDFLDQPLDRSLLEADGARRKPPEADDAD